MSDMASLKSLHPSLIFFTPFLIPDAQQWAYKLWLAYSRYHCSQGFATATMPLSREDRHKNYMLKLESDPELIAEHRRKDRERKKLQRQQKNGQLTKGERERIRQANCEQKRRERERKKKQKENLQTPSSSSSSFRSRSSLGKAVKRVANQLPKSPAREAEALGTLFNERLRQMTPSKREIALEQLKEPVAKRRLLSPDPQRKTRCDSINLETTENVRQFYLRDDISRMCPGRKDCVTVRTSGQKERLQKRLMIMNLAEAHQIYLKDNPERSVGLSKFCEMRPQQVQLLSEKDQQVCLCKYHENADLITSAFSSITHMPSQADKLLNKTVCSMENEQCVDRACAECGVDNMDTYFEDCDMNQKFTYYQWVISEGKVMKLQIESDVTSAKDELYKQIKSLARHCYDAKRQHAELRQLKDDLKPGQIVLHEDFSENYAIRQQGEIMSAHWCAAQVTIFTAIVYFRPEEGAALQHESYSIVSDELHHNKQSVFAFNSKILQDVGMKLPWKIERVHYWSDGAGSQFKNKFNFVNLLHHKSDMGCEADWSFFATSHGKGPIDGIGGEVKRSVWRDVLKGNVVVNSALEFYEAAIKLNKTITVLYVKQEEIQEVADNLQERWNDCKTIPGTHSFHYVVPVSGAVVACGKNSVFAGNLTNLVEFALVKDQLPIPARAATSERAKGSVVSAPGDFILVEYNKGKTKSMFLGQVLTKDGSDYEVTFLRAKDEGKMVFIFPATEDIAWVEHKQIKEKVETPPSVDNHLRYTFSAILPVTE